MIRIPKGKAQPDVVISTCATCHPTQDDRGGYIQTAYPCWYTVAEAEALKGVLLGALGANSRAIEVEVSAAPENSAFSTLWHLAMESQDSDGVLTAVMNAFDIPRLVRRARGFEEWLPCTQPADPVKTPLARHECAVIALNDLVMKKASARKHYRELIWSLGTRIEAARMEATRKGQPATATVWIEPAKRIYIPVGLIPDQCSNCPEIRPEEDQEPLE